MCIWNAEEVRGSTSSALRARQCSFGRIGQREGGKLGDGRSYGNRQEYFETLICNDRGWSELTVNGPPAHSAIHGPW